jgi:hypothetical protein
MKKKSLVVLLSGLVIAAVVITLNVERTDAQVNTSGEAAWGNVSFTNHRYALMFFDHETGEIYHYAEDGKLQEVWVLEELGKDLKKKVSKGPYGLEEKQ